MCVQGPVVRPAAWRCCRSSAREGRAHGSRAALRLWAPATRCSGSGPIHAAIITKRLNVALRLCRLDLLSHSHSQMKTEHKGCFVLLLRTSFDNVGPASGSSVGVDVRVCGRVRALGLGWFSCLLSGSV